MHCQCYWKGEASRSPYVHASLERGFESELVGLWWTDCLNDSVIKYREQSLQVGELLS